jgi:hypothetical protein
VLLSAEPAWVLQHKIHSNGRTAQNFGHLMRSVFQSAIALLSTALYDVCKTMFEDSLTAGVPTGLVVAIK